MKKSLLIASLLLTLNALSQLKLTYVNPGTDEIRIKNFGASAVNITNYRLCALFEYANLVEPTVNIINGDFDLASGEEVAFTWASATGFNTTASDLGLYLPSGAFSSPASMVDFMQYGAGGQGRESVANSAGLWTAGQFLTGAGPWYYIGDGSASGLVQWTDQLIIGPNLDVRINEVDPDQVSTDTEEFVELYGEPNTALDGLVLVFISGAPSDLSYDAYDLDSYSLDENGFFVLGSAIVPNVDMTLNGAIQNGADAVALYVGDAADWPVGTPASSTGLVDAMVYGTGEAPDDGLLATLTPGQVQLDDAGNSTTSFSRVPDGGPAFDITTYLIQDPTPGVSNVPACSGATVVLISGELNQCSEATNDAVVVSTTSQFGENYLYILTDINDNIISTGTDGSIDANSLSDGEYHIWGFSYNGTLDENSITPGLTINGVLSDNCYGLSSNFLTILRAVCTLDVCDGGTIQTSTGSTYISFCSGNGSDLYAFEAQNSSTADGYVFVLADADGLIVQVLESNSVNLNAIPVGDYFLSGISYFTGLDASTTEVGDTLANVATIGACLDFSDNTIEIHVLDCTPGEGCSKLFISEYLEGTSNNKALEIYNPTPFPVDLSDYDLFSYANGAIDFTSVVALEGTILPGGVYVIANSQADAAILAQADQTAGIATFNGNDALVLTYNLEPIDIIGVIGVDPGTSGWQFGNTSTVDHVLVRNIDVNSPTTNWLLSQGQWTSYEATDFSHIGAHSAIACSGEAFVTFDVSAVQVEETVGVLEITVSAFNVSVDVPITIDISGASATEGLDFVNPFPTTLTFTPTNNVQVISLEIIDDLVEEDAFEYITLTMNDDDDLATFVNQNLTISIAPSDQNYPLYTIGEIVGETSEGIADSTDVFCTITGIVHGINFNPNGTEFTLIDGTGGIKVFDADENFGYTVLEGDSIVVLGQVTQFMGMTQFFPDQIIYVDGGHELEVPSILTTIGESNESHIVKLVCVALVDPTQWTQIGSGFDVDVTDGTNNFVMHIDLNTDIYASSAPEGHFTVVGIGAQQDADLPYDSGYKFWPTALSDFSNQVIASFTMPASLVYTDSGASIDFVNSSSGATSYDWNFGDGSNSSLEIVSHDYSYAFLSGQADLTVSLTVTSGDGCVDTQSTTVDVIYTAVEEMSGGGISMYPNPSNGLVTIQNAEEIKNISIYDANGRLIRKESSFTGRQAKLDLTDLVSGTYWIEVQGVNESSKARVIKL